jgi:hypothetical protein
MKLARTENSGVKAGGEFAIEETLRAFAIELGV